MVHIRISCLLAVFVFTAIFTAGCPAESAAQGAENVAKALPGFNFENVVERARLLAREPFQNLGGKIPKNLMSQHLSYDDWRDIRFKPEQSLWRSENLPFEIQFFHLGLYYDLPVTVNVIDGADVKKINYRSDMFNYGRNEDLAKTLPADLGFAGLRLHYPIKNKEYKDEVAVFLGASYFRGVGKNHYYGLSARGLAIDTAASRSEEFPCFREFWLVKPNPEDTSITIFALLDSPSTTGAYEFQISPGEETVMEVRSQIIQRHRVTTLGVAPLTSMFFYGENFNCHRYDDFRPEIHDSDGLSLSSGTGEWLWRPLTAPEDRVLTNAFMVEELRGFGLMQRDQNFDHYQDLEAHYQGRPSVFITPKGDWGPGEVRLVQIPSDSEVHDNVVAFWVPRQAPSPGTPMNFNYRLAWTTARPETPDIGQVVSTRRAKGSYEKASKFIIDFEGPSLSKLPAGTKIETSISIDGDTELLESQVVKNDITGGWRLIFQVKSKKDDALNALLSGPKKPLAEMRAFLKLDGQVLTETWSYGTDL